LCVSNEQYKINILSLEGEKRKNKGHPRGLVIQLIAFMERFISKNLTATIPDIYDVF
jgi:hypothetical protein